MHKQKLNTARLRAIGITAFVAALLAGPAALSAQDTPVDFAHFDCWKVRRTDDRLELDRLTSAGPVATVFNCSGRSCVNRAQIEAKDGTISEVFRYIYFPRDRNEYVSSWAMWRQGEDTPVIQRSTVYQLVQCRDPAPQG